MSYVPRPPVRALEALGCLLMVVSAAMVSCAASLPVGTVDGHAGSRYSGPPPAVTSTSADGVHVVAPGETLWRIATQNGVSVDELAKLNGMDDPSQLRAGQKLRVPVRTGSLALERARALAKGDAPRSSDDTSEAKAVREQKPKPAQRTKTRPKKPASRVSVAQYPFRWPVRGKILRRYGRHGKKHHDGIDIQAGSGAPVKAAGSGKVVFADHHGGYGKLVLLRHDNGVITVYAHQSELLVRKGQRVRGGDLIARVGSTGNAERPHLHFEVRRGIEAKNPLQFLPP